MRRFIVAMFTWLLQCMLGENYEGCNTPQFLDYGKSGAIHCFFHDNFTAVFWYDSANIAVDEPIVTLINSVKGGRGYESGDFDITSNGWLLINDVDVGLGKNFTVAKFTSLNEDPSVFVVFAVVTGVISDGCESPQYLEYGSTGVVHCHFQADFVTAWWYNSTDTVVDAPIVIYSKSAKSGRGYESGEFDVNLNGSLVINEVGLVHEHNYTVAKFTSFNEDPTIFAVLVIVTVKSLIGGPVIDKCENVNTTCYVELDRFSAIECTVRRVRPAVSLKWLIRTGYGDRNMSFNVNSSSDDVTFTSRAVTLDAFAYSPVLSLLVCKADFVSDVLQRDESLVLVQNSERNLSSGPYVTKYAPRSSTLELECTINETSFFVWKRSFLFDIDYHNLMFAISIENENYVVTEYQDHFKVEKNASLVLHNIDLQHEGFYICIHGDGITDGMTKYKVVTYVKPVPPYPVVDGCKYQHHCKLEVHRKGNLTCSMSGIRPEVKLEWNASNETSAGKISFFDHTSTVTKSSETFNITLTSSYSVQSVTQVTVVCGVSGTGSDIFPEIAVVDLFFVPALVNQTEDSVVLVIIYVVVLILVCVGLLLLCCIRLQKALKNKTDDPGVLVIVSGVVLILVLILMDLLLCGILLQKALVNQMDASIVVLWIVSVGVLILVCVGLLLFGKRLQKIEKKTQFMTELKYKYKNLCGDIHPAPFLRDKYDIDKLFVENGIKFFLEDKEGESKEQEKWTMLKDYKTVFTNPKIKTKRRIIEGEPGYGKSALALQITHDWCLGIAPMNKFQILILLRLRQFSNVTTVYSAIKRFLLTKYSKVTEDDIKSILDSSSTIILLDEYDTYPDRGKEDTDINHIIRGDLFQKHEVVLLTRTSCLPPSHSSTTKRIRLTGFDDTSRKTYIRNMVARGCSDVADNISTFLKVNPVPADLWNSPLFFAMISYMVKSSESFQNLKTATQVFQYIIKCFHSHNEFKVTEENREAKLDHSKLDKVAFEGLSGDMYQISWVKNELRGKIGKDLYDKYVRIGILIEDECFDYDAMQNITETRFFRKSFAEWYAAHYLAKVAAQPEAAFEPWPEDDFAVWRNPRRRAADTSQLHQAANSGMVPLLKSLSPHELHYMYRYACGLDPEAALKIIQHLRENKQFDKYTLLCMTEWSGSLETIKDTVALLCSREIIIRDTDSVLLQKSTVALIEFASRRKIPIQSVELYDCLDVGCSGTPSVKPSNKPLPVIHTLSSLLIHQNGLKIKEEETDSILQYSAKCLRLKLLLFEHCLCPRYINVTESMSVLRQRDVTVQCFPGIGHYLLNLESGQWEDRRDRTPMTDNQYQREVEEVRKWAEESRDPSSEDSNIAAAAGAATHSSVENQSLIGTSERKDPHLNLTIDVLKNEYTATWAATHSSEENQSLIGKRKSPDPHLDAMIDVFTYLSTHLSAEWKDVGRRLGLTESLLYSIISDGGSSQESIYRMLTSWKQRLGSEATLNKLKDALERVDRKDLADHLGYM